MVITCKLAFGITVIDILRMFIKVPYGRLTDLVDPPLLAVCRRYKPHFATGEPAPESRWAVSADWSTRRQSPHR